MTPTERRARLKRLKSEIAELTNAELAELMHPEIDRRSLGPDGAPKRDALRWGVTNCLFALLEEPIDKHETAMVEQAETVFRGAVAVRRDDAAARARLLKPLVLATLRSKNLPECDKVESLARTIEAEWPDLVPVDREKLKAVLAKRSRGDRMVAAVARAARIVRARDDEQAFNLLKKAWID